MTCRWEVCTTKTQDQCSGFQVKEQLEIRGISLLEINKVMWGTLKNKLVEHTRDKYIKRETGEIFLVATWGTGEGMVTMETHLWVHQEAIKEIRVHQGAIKEIRVHREATKEIRVNTRVHQEVNQEFRDKLINNHRKVYILHNSK